MSVRVLEARDRVGGRTLNKPLGPGDVVEMGGQWIGPGQDHIAGLASELGVETFPTYDAVFDRPFWRETGLSGQSASIVGPVSSTFDSSPPAGRPGVLLGFVEGRAARDLGRASREVRQAAVLDGLTKLFGARAGNPDDYFESEWASDPWTRGCYMGYLTPGGWASHGRALRSPSGRIHWAGTETAITWFGSMDGAVSAGQRTAAEASSSLELTAPSPVPLTAPT